MALRLMHRHIEDPEMQLPKIEQRIIYMFRPYQILDHLIR